MYFVALYKTAEKKYRHTHSTLQYEHRAHHYVSVSVECRKVVFSPKHEKHEKRCQSDILTKNWCAIEEKKATFCEI